uniref:Borealin n=1 Tax=Varanus komodoensis TaxID=61221 RepID=A0A8D2LCX7_VARKO
THPRAGAAEGSCSRSARTPSLPSGEARGSCTRGRAPATSCRPLQSLQKDVENTFNIKLLSVPLALREMNWLEFLGTRRSGGDLAMDADIQEITKLASEVMDTPLKTVRKGQWRASSAQPGALIPGEPSCRLPLRGLPGRQSREAPRPQGSFGGGPAPHCRCPVPPACLPACPGVCPPQPGCSAATRAPASLPSIFKTPGLRAPAAQERVFSISANGSPLADGNEIFLTLPMGGGEVRQRGAAGRGWGRASSEQELVGGGWGQSLAGPRGHGAPQTSSGWVWVA